MKSLLKFCLGAIILTLGFQAMAQQPSIQNFRPYNQDGVNIFEPGKKDGILFEGVKVRIGGNFAQQYQALSHENQANFRPGIYQGDTVNLNQLYPLGNGFNLATANLNIDVQLADGIRVAVESYMSSRHHSEFWVKGGYIQIDKLSMFENTAWFDDVFRVKIGHFQVNYGDMQFRRTDNGNAMWNPFIGNYIMDAFATEIGGEVYAFPTENFMAMVGMTSGLIKGDIDDYAGTTTKKNPSIYAKLAYDQQVNPDLRFRISGSVYANSGTPRNTLYGGDRAGSRFYLAMEPEYIADWRTGAVNRASAGSQFTSGRINPGFSNEITAFQINPFVKFKGLEFFGTYEMASGKASSEADKRDVTQIGAEVLYRFLKNEQLYIGGRYNNLSGELGSRTGEVSVNRMEFAAGWYPIKNLLLKGSYINQEYKDYQPSDLFYEGKFNGFMIEAVVGF